MRPRSWNVADSKRTIFDLIIRGQVLDMTVQTMSHNVVRGQYVAETCAEDWVEEIERTKRPQHVSSAKSNSSNCSREKVSSYCCLILHDRRRDALKTQPSSGSAFILLGLAVAQMFSTRMRHSRNPWEPLGCRSDSRIVSSCQGIIPSWPETPA